MRVLGVPVGTVDTVTPSGTDVVVTMSYDAETKVPADAEAVDHRPVASSATGSSSSRPSTRVARCSRTARRSATTRPSVPLELDQIYSSLDDLNVALGPTGANRNGALTDLLETTAENFGGQGEQFHQTIEDFSKFSQTLDNNKEELFGSAAALQGFIGTLAENDQTVRDFNQSLGDVVDHAGRGAGRAQGVAAQPRRRDAADLGVRPGEPRDPRVSNIKGLNRVAKVLVKQRGALDEILTAGPLALNNLYLTYNPQAGTLDTRSNQGEAEGQLASDPATFLCGIVNQADTSGEACDAIENGGFPGLPRSGVFGAGRVPRRRAVRPVPRWPRGGAEVKRLRSLLVVSPRPW